MINKKANAGNQLMFIAFFVILIIIAVGLTTGIYMFFGHDYDFRELDASILSYRITQCLAERQINFNLDKDAFTKKFFQQCNLNEKVMMQYYYIQIKVNDDEKLKFKDINKCAYTGKNPDYPACSENSIQINNNNVYILAGSDQKSRAEVA